MRKLFLFTIITSFFMVCNVYGQQVTGRNLAFAAYDGGSFIQTNGKNWVEHARDGTFNFVETGRDDWSVYMIDNSRGGVTIQLDIHRKEIIINWEKSNRSKLYTINRFLAVTGRNLAFAAYNGGKFAQTNGTNWVEYARDGTFNFVETGRDDWSVYLIDRKRGVTIQLDIHTKEIYINWEKSNRSKLYDITSTK